MTNVDFDAAVNLHRAGRVGEAARIYSQLVEQNPQHADAMYLLGGIMLQRGEAGAALSLLERAVKLNSQNATYQANLGEALRRVGRYPQAVDAFLSAIALSPELLEPIFNLGLTLRQGGLLDAALACFEVLVDAKPHVNQFQLELDKTRSAYAEQEGLPTSIEKRKALDTASSGVLLRLVDRDKALGRAERALELFRRALRHEPSNASIIMGMADLLGELGRPNEAAALLGEAAALAPDDMELKGALGWNLLVANRLTEAIKIFREVAPFVDDMELHSVLPFMLAYIPGCDARELLAEARAWGHKFAAPLTTTHASFDNDRSPHRRLRIGYVSADFKEHVDSCFLEPMFANFDKRLIDLVLYSDVKDPDATTTRIRSHADVWRDIHSLSDEEAAELIRRDQIDILVDLKMHSGNRLLVFARKPAPIQVCWLAYAGTTGLSAMDYRITDWYLDPPDTDLSVYSETSLRLPDSFWCFDPLVSGSPEVDPLPALAAGTVTFGCLNKYYKINDEVLGLWIRLLREVEGSRLLLHLPQGDVQAKALSNLANWGLDTSRVTCVGVVPRHEYLKMYHSIDVCLDPFPYNGGTTSLEALWMGVPVITLRGKTAMGRAGYSIAMNLGLEDLVATSPDEYVRIAKELSLDLPRLNALRAELRQRLESSPLMDGPRFARNMESLFRQIWTKWCNRREDGARGSDE